VADNQRSPQEMRDRLENARAEALRIQRQEQAKNGRKSPQQVRDTHQQNRRSGDR
jgi:hypothetical protein